MRAFQNRRRSIEWKNVCVPLTAAFLAIGVAQSATATEYCGNAFEASGTASTGLIDAANKQAAIRFTAQAAKAVTAFRLFVHNNQSGSKTFRYGLQEDSGGLPGGAWLAYRDLIITGSSGWLTVTLVSSVNVTSGHVYHIVVQPIDPPNKAIALRATTPVNASRLYDQSSDPMANTLFFNGSTWTVQGRQPVYMLDFSDGTSEGSPCHMASYASVFGELSEAERFALSGTDRIVTQVAACLRREGNPPDDCGFVLYDITHSQEMASGTIVRASEVTTAFAWYTADLSTPVTIVAGTQYRLSFRTSGGSTTDRYHLLMTYNFDADPYNSRNFGGLGCFNETSMDGGATWPESWRNYDITFRLSLYSLAVSVDPASVGLGAIPAGLSDVISQSARPQGEILVTNSGTVKVKYELRLANPEGWTSVPGVPANPEEYRLSGLFHPDQAVGGDFSKAGPLYRDVIGTGAKVCDGTFFATGATNDGYDVGPATTQALYFNFDAPPETSIRSEQAIQMTITALPMP